VESKGQEDHAVFICFAPKENPKIAVSVIVENAGFGGTWAAPIASLIMEKHLTGKIKNQAKLDRILQQDFIAKEAEARKRSLQAQVNPVPTE
jgi:penicillin-binding protein 2